MALRNLHAPDDQTTDALPSAAPAIKTVDIQESSVCQDSLINLYKRTNTKDRHRILSVLETAELQILYDFYLDELNDKILHLQKINHPTYEVACELYTEIEMLRMQRFSTKRFNEFSDVHLFDAIHKTTSMLSCIQDDHSLKAEFFNKANEFSTTALSLKNEAKTHRTSGIYTAVQMSIVIAAIIACCIFSIVTYGFTLGLLPMLIGGGAGVALVGISSGIRAHTMFAQAKKEDALAGVMDKLGEAVRVSPSG